MPKSSSELLSRIANRIRDLLDEQSARRQALKHLPRFELKEADEILA